MVLVWPQKLKVKKPALFYDSDEEAAEDEEAFLQAKQAREQFRADLEAERARILAVQQALNELSDDLDLRAQLLDGWRNHLYLKAQLLDG